MRRVALVLALALGCGGDEEPDCPSLGCFADTGTATSASATTSTSTSSTSTSSSTAESSSTATTSDEDTAGTSTTAATTTSETSSDSSTSAPPCDGADCPSLAECFGLGVWQSCTQYCDAIAATCVAGGCDGATVVYYGDVDTCTAMRPSGSSAQSCDDGFAMGGGASFGRCCCN